MDNQLILKSDNALGSIVFAHGGPGMDYSYFPDYFSSLTNLFNLYFYNQSRDLEIEDLVAELSEQISKASKPVYLLGHSFGGTLAAMYLKCIREVEINGLILIATPLDHSFNALAEDACANLPLQTVDWTPKNIDEKVKHEDLEHIAVYFTEPFWQTGMDIINKVEYSKSSMDKLEPFLKKIDLHEDIKKTKVPILNIYGLNDLRVPAEYCATISILGDHITDAPIPGVGHYPFVENSHVVCHAIQNFLM